MAEFMGAGADDGGLSVSEATREGELRILFTGPRRSGKSSIERVVFHKMSPHETLFLEGTQLVDVHSINHLDFLRFQTWDFGGDIALDSDVMYRDTSIPIEKLLRNSCTLLYVIDAQEDDYEDSLPKLVELISFAHRINPKIHFEVFLHKIDGDAMSDEDKSYRQQHIQNYVSSELAVAGQGEVLVSYYLTSIYDHSALEAFSKVVQKLIPQLPTLNNLLDILISSCNIDKTYIIDVVTKCYIATDSNPVDVHTYELCSDLVDVVIDVSSIYGNTAVSNGAPGGSTGPYDSESRSSIKLTSGLILYLREVGSCLALVCVMKDEYFNKRSLVDYNIDCFKASLMRVFAEQDTKPLSPSISSSSSAGGGGGALSDK